MQILVILNNLVSFYFQRWLIWFLPACIDQQCCDECVTSAPKITQHSVEPCVHDAIVGRGQCPLCHVLSNLHQQLSIVQYPFILIKEIFEQSIQVALKTM